MRLDSDSDDVPEERLALWAEYNRRVFESDGFDIDDDVYPGAPAMFEPLSYFKDERELYATVKAMARQALKTFKDNSGKEYELVDVDKVVWTLNLHYFLTIKGKQLGAEDDVVKTIQAVVHNKFRGNFDVKLCRLKPDKLNKIG